VDLTRIPTQGWALVDEFQAAALIGLPVKRLRKHRVLGLGPEFIKIGATVRYSLRSLEVYVSNLPTGGNGVPTRALKTTVSHPRQAGNTTPGLTDSGKSSNTQGSTRK
jgi:hypothetical protein